MFTFGFCVLMSYVSHVGMPCAMRHAPPPLDLHLARLPSVLFEYGRTATQKPLVRPPHGPPLPAEPLCATAETCGCPAVARTEC